MRNARKAAKTKGLSLLKNFGISGFSYVANATTELLAVRRGGISRKKISEQEKVQSPIGENQAFDTEMLLDLKSMFVR